MSVFMAVLVALIIAIATLVFIICYLCDDIIIEKFFSRLSKRTQYILYVIVVIYFIIDLLFIINKYIIK